MHYICICVCHTQICNVRRRKKTHIFDKGQCNDLLQNTQLSEEYKAPKNAKSLTICSFLQHFYIYITITLKGMQKGTFLMKEGLLTSNATGIAFMSAFICKYSTKHIKQVT